jgi:hypothetical protein
MKRQIWLYWADGVDAADKVEIAIIPFIYAVFREE